MPNWCHDNVKFGTPKILKECVAGYEEEKKFREELAI